MSISSERASDRVEFLRAFLELARSFEILSEKTNLRSDPDVAGAMEKLNTLVDTMLNRLEADQK